MTSMYERELQRRDVVSKRLYRICIFANLFLFIVGAAAIALLLKP